MKIPPDKIDKGINDILKKRLGSSLAKTKRAVTRGTLIVRDTAIIGIARGKKTGRTYTRGSITHRASAPGEMPATDTGFLISQITTDVKTIGNTVIGQIISAAPYSRHLEFGTRNMLNPKSGEPGGARPFMVPALEQNKRRVKEIFIQEGVVKK